MKMSDTKNDRNCQWFLRKGKEFLMSIIKEDSTPMEQMKKRVHRILLEDYKARDDDQYLYYLVCKEYCEEQGYNVDTIQFRTVMLEKKCNIPNMSTVRRCRAKLQEEDKSLWGDRRQERMEAQEAYLDFVRE